jgi:tetratricopeptide (TPR) repeat protein
MSLKAKIKSYLQEAALYSSQGLNNEAMERYKSASRLIRQNEQLKNRENLLNSIAQKISELDTDSDTLEEKIESPELTEEAQNLIKRLFSFSDKKDKEEAALEGAIALAKFGLFDRAIVEFQALIRNDSHRFAAAKNIIRCHMSQSTLDDAVELYREWLDGDLFKADQLISIRTYLADCLQKKGHDIDLPEPETVQAGRGTGVITDNQNSLTEPLSEPVESESDDQGEFLDITSIGITLDEGSSKGKMVEFDVNFQSGSLLSLIIPSRDGSLIESLKAGLKLDNIQYFSPIAIFKGTGMVSSKTQIENGPKKGDFCLDIKILNQ